MILSTYSLDQWLVFFFIYCFLGWIWETGYVSWKQKEFVNRGFMHGPFLPIYGSGAIVVLISTLSVRENAVLVFLLGMIGATLLEYVTGLAMERIFGVRYWDYSNEPLNVKGYICIISSLAWGGFSVLMVYMLHRPLEYAVLKLPTLVLDIGSTVLSVYMAIDMTISFREAMDLKDILSKLTESNEEIRRIKNRLDSMMLNLKNRNKELGLHNLDKFLSENRRKYDNLMHEQRERINELKRTGLKQLENNIEIQREKSGILLKHFSESLNGILIIIEAKETKLKEMNVKEANVKETNVKEMNVKETNVKETNVKETNVKEANVKEMNEKEMNKKDINIKELKKEQIDLKDNNEKVVISNEVNCNETISDGSYENIHREADYCNACISEQESRLNYLKNRTYRKALRFLKRYPCTTSSKFADVLGDIKSKHSRNEL